MEIPGVDPHSPLPLHIDQVDIQICEKLREIDASMASIHSVLTFEILPGLKEYARVTEPMRDVSKFWISMFQAACAPKQEPAEPDLTSTVDPTHTPTASSSINHIRSNANDTTPTTSENQSFRDFQEGAEGSGNLQTSTPVVRRKADGSIASAEGKGDSTFSSAIESTQDRLRREIAALEDKSSFDLSETSTNHNPILSSDSASFTSASSAQTNAAASSFLKGKGRVAPDLRSKALHNAAAGNNLNVFKEHPSFASTNPDTSISQADINLKPLPIFNPSLKPQDNQSIFTRVQKQIFAPPGPGAASAAQHRMMQGLLREAAAEKRAGVPAGAASPYKSPARFNYQRKIPPGPLKDFSLSTDDDTMSTTGGNQEHQVDEYGNEVLGGSRRAWESDEFDSSDEDDDEYVQKHASMHISRQYEVESDPSVDSTGWRPRSETTDTQIIGGGGATGDTLFGVGNPRFMRQNFQLQNGLPGAGGSDSFAVETPLQARRGDSRY